jgi:hypothetical protein
MEYMLEMLGYFLRFSLATEADIKQEERVPIVSAADLVSSPAAILVRVDSL